ncbi:Uncharacterised protein [Enterobacter cloacae]|nr:Uncharacterised protein [Enterobacter cloacae]
MFAGYFLHTHMCQPLLYPLQYLVDQLALRSSATQSASLQALKFFYEFWHQKYGVTFCFSFYSSYHNPLIAIEELTALFHYLENGCSCAPVLTIGSTQTTPQRRTNIRHAHAVIRFIRYLINTYISSRHMDGSPKELTQLATQLMSRLSIQKEEFRSLAHSRQMNNGMTYKRFRSLTTFSTRRTSKGVFVDSPATGINDTHLRTSFTPRCYAAGYRQTLKVLDLFNIRGLHAAVSGLPVVVCGFRDTSLPADIFNGSSGFNRLNHSDDLILSKTGFTHRDLLRWKIDYAG